MEVITRRSRAAEAHERWERQYGDATGDKKAITQRLAALGAWPEPEAVNAVIGNDSWTECTCNECGESVPLVVRLGEPPDYESSTADVCERCLSAALARIEELRDTTSVTLRT